MLPVRGYQGHKVAVLGLGRSGLKAALALKQGGAIALCWDDGEEARLRAAALGLSIHDLNRAGAFTDVSVLIVSPGIGHLYPRPHPVVAAAGDAGVPLDNDIGLFFRSYATGDWGAFDVMPQVVAITGSNGKSTTSALIHHVLDAAGRPAQLGGNIGRGVLDLDPARDGEVAVLELSSYQSELARTLTPDIALFLNLTPDHLDRHGGLGGYFAAKRRLFMEGAPERAVIGVDEPEGRFLAGQLAEGPGASGPLIRISSGQKLKGDGWNVFARKGFLAEWRKGRQVASVDLRDITGLAGAHNHQNACAAYSACRALGLAPRAIEAGFRGFRGLPHRSQVVGKRNGVTFVNDSKATNAESARHALRSFPRIRWIAGGQGKEGGIAGITAVFGHVAKAYLIGCSATEFAADLGETPHEICATMDVAVARAAQDAEPGDTVLLAPAAASFDQYADFEKRGEDFMAQVAAFLAGT